MEINKEKPYNPIMYDIVDNKIRKVTYQAKGSMHAGYPFHYGALPQTWDQKGMRIGEHKDMVITIRSMSLIFHHFPLNQV